MVYETYEDQKGKSTTTSIEVEIDGADGKSLLIERGVVSIVDFEGSQLNHL